MTAVPDDILKAIAVAVEAQQSAYAFDAQIAEDSLKYSNWMSALAVAILLTIASSFSDLRLLTLPGIAIELPLICMLILLLSCLVIGGIYHKFVLNQLKIKRQIMTLGLKQHSILLSSDQSISSGISLCRQVWDLEFLSDKDKTGLKKLSDSEETRVVIDWANVIDRISGWDALCRVVVRCAAKILNQSLRQALTARSNTLSNIAALSRPVFWL